MTTGGFKRQYVATKAETISTIKKLLQRRKNFMAARGLHDGDSQSVNGRYLFTQKDRQELMQEWKNEFHAGPEQLEQQKRDSWKPHGPPDNGGEWGLNHNATRHGKHSRFHRHLQLEAGSKTMAELIIYAGRYDPEFLNNVHKASEHSGAPQPAAWAAMQQQLKRAAASAKLEYRKTCLLRRRLEDGKVKLRDLDWWQQQNLQALQDGSLLTKTNHAIAAYGHGTLCTTDETLEIGGSTGGITRFLLDGYEEPDVNTFLARR